jgi:hypothetical protein
MRRISRSFGHSHANGMSICTWWAEASTRAPISSSLFHDLTAHHQLCCRLVSFEAITIAELSCHYLREYALVFICLRAARRWVAHRTSWPMTEHGTSALHRICICILPVVLKSRVSPYHARYPPCSGVHIAWNLFYALCDRMYAVGRLGSFAMRSRLLLHFRLGGLA